MKISQKGIHLIKSFEGCSLTAYKCPAGIWTIGYGHTGDVKAGQTVTKQEAEEFLRKDLQKYEDGVTKNVKVEINQHQFDALVSFAYNCGIGALKKSNLLQLLNNGDMQGASAEFGEWIHGGGKVLPGLVKRREAERALFTTAVPDPSVAKPVANAKTETVYYVVKKGDTVTKIAASYKTSVTKIQQINKLVNANLIYPGQKLRVR